MTFSRTLPPSIGQLLQLPAQLYIGDTYTMHPLAQRASRHDDQLDAGRHTQEMLAYCKADVKLTAQKAPEGIVEMERIGNQQVAIDTFETILARAKLFLAGSLSGECNQFHNHYGICDNVSRSIPEYAKDYDEIHSTMSLVKDNVIRITPSYSGNYHYPVKSGRPSTKPEYVARDAENAYDNAGCMWSGEYGANRIQQVEQIINIVRNNWREEFTKRMTACDRLGLIKHETILRHKETGVLWVLDYDDDSSCPYFKEFGKLDGRDNECLDLSDLEVLSVGNKSHTVPGYLRAMDRSEAVQAKLKLQIEALQSKLLTAQVESANLAIGLRRQHGVIRAK